ncbi:hypothetical protein A0U89_14135 (plasmid) [Kozakia baliensis]|uniref:Uncharacterized protein n=1 Tax=Kozakia baliensis TaxID=153496 RepID=A0A1D8UXL5_9PROT|nr:hypothetical protein A0U89_14135 [Kozakia baliensis]
MTCLQAIRPLPDFAGVAIPAKSVLCRTRRRLMHKTSLNNLTPADVWLGRGQAILLERERIKRDTIQTRRLLHQQRAA